MPFYIYRCEACKEEFEIRHGMFFIQEKCVKCHSDGFLFKVPSFGGLKANANIPIGTKPGTIVDKYIEEVRKEVKDEKRKLKSKEL